MNIDVGRVGIWSSSSAWEHARDLADAAAELEELGYGALWLGSSRGDMELPSTLLASTRRLVVATAIMNIWTNPAQQLGVRYAQLEARTPHRLLVGLGSSHVLDSPDYQPSNPLPRDGWRLLAAGLREAVGAG